MNKITSTFAGLAIVATASIAPAFAQGNFTSTAPFTFTSTGTTVSVLSAPVLFNPKAGGATSAGTLALSLTGGMAGSPFFSGVSLTFTGAGGFTDTTFTNGADVNLIPAGPLAGTYEIVSAGPSTTGNSFDLSPGTTSPVPEASTVVSFGALLALGGLAVVLRRKGVKNVA